MKIEAPKNVGTASRVSKTKKASGGSGFSEQVSMGSEEDNTTPVHSSSPLSAVESILTVQQLSNVDDNRKQERRRGNDMLDDLEKLRADLLLGKIPESRLQNLQTLLEKRIEGTFDPKLEKILKEIEVRVSVELAKLEQLQK